MDASATLTERSWKWEEKVAFRFFFLFFMLYIAPWTWPSSLPFTGDLLSFFNDLHWGAADWLIQLVKKHILHIDIKITPNGSGDTVDDWTWNGIMLFISSIGTAIWSLVDARRREYNALYTWLQVIVRYQLAMSMFTYGFIKIFPMQMPEPSISQLATPLGEFTSMRFAWLFIGSSPSYEIFSGICEVLGGLLMLSRRTTAFGAMILVGVIGHVVALNFFFDIQVKLFSTALLLMAIFLLVPHMQKIWAFFIQNQHVRLSIPVINLTKKWQRTTRIALKTLFIAVFCLISFYENMSAYGKGGYMPLDKPTVTEGFFDVEAFEVNKKPLTLLADTTRWDNVIFEKWNGGSIKRQPADSPLMRYGREYFTYKADTAKKTFEMQYRDSTRNFTLHYKEPDSSRMLLYGKSGNDSLHILLRKTSQPFRLNEPMHWVHNSIR
ncbi:hypothetical protein [Dyadobacter sp. CY351]|uniref:hypothetical protein n=1 Tax=Dyadobacter sp. CY351 TaxID=2909337 RepID=UPI001F1B4C51|nr:hypothetical protein [Dyadobacter sp. CY351]MCF2517435.1 hypothetical protein [Dyadobacter sp. CY351]